ncbi:MAG: Acyl-homoserine lactone acylase QuiP [Burkholderiaceae bacterium]|nr:Acyl-homoserine lactone acylase QuiP [Burkholderiaceae bacterium]
MKWLRGAGWLAMALLLLAALAGSVYTTRAMPTIDGRLDVAGLQQPVRIERDAQGIPTIKAQNQHDLWFALGFVHAQDRLWQLETHRRIGAGRLAEAFGPAALSSDKFLRALGVRRAAAAQWAHVKPEARAVLQAYADGINAVIGTLRARPPEMVILGVRPQPWEPADSLAWAIMMAYDLGGNWNNELLRLRLSLRLPVQRINELLPPYPGEKPLPSADYAALYRALKLDSATATASLDRTLERLMAAAPPSGVEGVGSNNWVVAGSHTTTGSPLLANDPHLKLSVPALWYFARLEAPGIEMAGATMPGLPVLVLGQNQQVAWGFTNTNPDVQDLYLERLHPADANQAQGPDGGWYPLKIFDETIKVRGGPDVAIKVRESRHGPLISDAGITDDLLGDKARNSFAIAMRWTALDADVDTVGAALAMNRAGDVASFIEAAKGWVAPMQNMVVADRAGHIGFIAPGRVPLRKADNDLFGLVPAPGWDARYDWDGWLSRDALPQARDPERGWIATANQRVVPADYPHFLTSEWALPYRQQRIEQLLEAKPKLSLDDLRAIQADVKSLAAVQMLPWLRRAKSDHPLAAAAAQALDGFDGTMAADKAAPLVYWAWLRHLVQQVFADEMGPVYERAIASRTLVDALQQVLDTDNAWWCDDKTTPAVAETCQQQVDRALGAALDELQQAHGSDVASWQWGKAHQARSEHRPFSRVKLLARWFELRTPVGGDSYTVDATRVLFKPDPTTGELYLAEHGPSLRALYDLADPKRSRFMHSTGQSGLAWSTWYSNFVQPWARVETVPLWSDGPSRDTLAIEPVR